MTKQVPGPDELPVGVLNDVAAVLGAGVTVRGRLRGGVNAGGLRVEVVGGGDAVLKVERLTHPGQFEGLVRARRIVERMRGRGYPTPAWLCVGSTDTHVWHLADFIDAAHAATLTPSIVEQLMAIVELQAGQAFEPYDHWSFAWRIVHGDELTPDGPPWEEAPEQVTLRRSVARLASHSREVSALIQRGRLMCAGAAPPGAAPDMVHADLNPSNVLVRDGVVVAIVDVANAGSGTRATDLTTLQWHTFTEPLDRVRHRLRERIVGLVGWQRAAELTAAHTLLQLEWARRLGSNDLLATVVGRGHLALDELDAHTR
ncbi:phosphotransferase [Nocardioides bruguierae]|uniref:Phosphotransferase n=1 Tax=Nocardioides bruguierae TaxID=2945102 RepID=A0A9X2ICT4_9ACTN|nr:phosphotransferase [Nocardioides bruguierae]MCM0619041.1 phosphotransferase [Nocardioides bruguierae]